MMKLGALTAAAVIAAGICSLPTDASAARGGAHFGGGGARMGSAAHFRGGGAHFDRARVAGNVGGWNGYRGYGYGGGYAWGRLSGYPAYTSCYVWTPLGYVNECGYDYNYYW
jgi:hypothetical protein